VIRIETDTRVDFSADSSPLNPAQAIDPAAQARLLAALGEYLRLKGVGSGVALGDTGGGDAPSVSLSISEMDGYWVVASTERGERRFLGLFYSFMDAVKFLLMKVSGDRQAADFPWDTIFV